LGNIIHLNLIWHNGHNGLYRDNGLYRHYRCYGLFYGHYGHIYRRHGRSRLYRHVNGRSGLFHGLFNWRSGLFNGRSGLFHGLFRRHNGLYRHVNGRSGHNGLFNGHNRHFYRHNRFFYGCYGLRSGHNRLRSRLYGLRSRLYGLRSGLYGLKRRRHRKSSIRQDIPRITNDPIHLYGRRLGRLVRRQSMNASIETRDARRCGNLLPRLKGEGHRRTRNTRLDGRGPRRHNKCSIRRRIIHREQP
jgi:hypothetical protein